MLLTSVVSSLHEARQFAVVIIMSKNVVREIKKDNSQLVSLIEKLRISAKPLWKKVAHELARPRRNRVQVNVSKIDLYARDTETILVPGKVLGSGQLSKKATIAAFSFSEGAKKSITIAGGTAISISDLFSNNPEGKQIIILT